MNCPRCNEEFDPDKNPECPACSEANKPFYRKNLSKNPDQPISIRLNDEERALLEEIKEILDIGSDGTALKLAAFKGWIVLQRTFGRDFLKWLCDKNRVNRKLK